MQKDYLEIGTVVGTHGLAGELKAQPACDGPEFFRQFSVLYWDAQGRAPVRVLGVRPHKNAALLRLEGVDTLSQAEALRGRTLYFLRSDAQLEDDQYFIAELLGCAVFDQNTGARYGALCDVTQTGANDVWHIAAAGGRTLLVPVIDEVVQRVDLAAGRIEITPLPGLFD